MKTWSLRVALGLLAAALFLWPDSAWARREHVVYFENTPYELNVYKIFGRKEGPTLMIIGGIQGDEPGGFLSADLYTDLALKKGNLIVVPRANFNSILLFQRGPGGDMNRRFGRDGNDYEARIVRVLEQLIAESDVLLNLHDGSGFFRAKHESELANPMRYGQSIIADAEIYTPKKTGRPLELKRMADQVIDRVNRQIDDPKYHFHFMNTRTEDKSSPYAEQRTSATYFALSRYGIPAFGVETSKNLPTIEMKVEQHNMAVNAFIELIGLEIEQPAIYLEKPRLSYLIVSINNQMPVAVADGETLFVQNGDQIEVIHVEANYKRGLSVDIQGLGTINDYRQKFKISGPTTIIAQKDHVKFGRVGVALRPQQVASLDPVPPVKAASNLPPASGSTAASVPSAPVPNSGKEGAFVIKSFVVEVQGRRMTVPAGGVLEAIWGDKIRIVDIAQDGPPPNNLVVNFRGFVGNPGNNNGEDRGVLIDTARDLMARYSLSPTEKVFEVAAEEGKKTLAKMTIRLIQKK